MLGSKDAQHCPGTRDTDTEITRRGESSSSESEAPRILAGGVSHRNRDESGPARRGAGISAAPQGSLSLGTGSRWLTPPVSNFHGASGSKRCPIFNSVWYDTISTVGRPQWREVAWASCPRNTGGTPVPRPLFTPPECRNRMTWISHIIGQTPSIREICVIRG